MDDDYNDDQLFSCAICGLSEGDASNLTTQNNLQTNATIGCGHQFCNSCVERELSRRKTFPCPICKTVVKRVTLSTRTLDDVQCEKDTSWRRRILKIYNKVEKDFPTLLEYNNYLEEVEDIIFSIVNEEPNAEEVKAKVKAYEDKNRSQIVIRQSQRADEERCIADRIASEAREAERRKRDFEEVEKAVASTKRKFKQETTEVMLGERDQVSAEVAAAQMQGYRNELIRQQRGRGGQTPGGGGLPRVREPEGGLGKDKVKDREMYRKRQAAGGGITSENIAVHERDWHFTVASMFLRKKIVSVLVLFKGAVAVCILFIHCLCQPSTQRVISRSVPPVAPATSPLTSKLKDKDSKTLSTTIHHEKNAFMSCIGKKIAENKQMNLITLLYTRSFTAVVVIFASIAILVSDSRFIVVEGASPADGIGKMMAAVKLTQRCQSRIPSVFIINHPLQTRLSEQSHSIIDRPLTSCAQQSYNHFLPTHRSLASISFRMSSVSEAIPTEGDAAALTRDDQTNYNELSSLSQKIRSLDESYYGGGGETDIIPDEEYDALARREAELCTRYPHLLSILEEQSGLGKEATRFGGRVGQSYKEEVEEQTTKKKKKASSRSATKKRQKRKHLENAPMQSLDNAMDEQEVVLWLNRVKKLLLSASSADADSDDDRIDTADQSIPLTIIAEPKIDGLSLSLRYELDKKQSYEATSIYNFVWGATRGDGKQGEDVSQAVKSAWIRNSTTTSDQRFSIPNSFRISGNEHSAPAIIEIRGEVVLPQASFDEFTRNVTESGDNKTSTFSNARNAASGILLRSKEPTSEEALEQTKWLQSRLTFYAYDIVASSPTNGGLSSDWLSLQFTENAMKMRESLSSIGFQVPNPVAMQGIVLSLDADNTKDDIPSLLDYHRKLLDDRDAAVSLPYQIDGVVYKVSSLTERIICGSSSRTPRWAIAHKFPPLCGVTRLNGIEVQLGRTGALTPVAILEPVDLGGVMVARASLHNFHYASKILLPSNNATTDERVVNKGVEVLVSRAGDVIPQIMKRIFDDDGSSEDGVISLEPPKHCPACGSPTTFGVTGASTRKSVKREQVAVEEDIQESQSKDEDESGQVLRCSGPQLLCKPRAINAMSYAYSRAGLDVKGLSKSKLQHLMDEDIIRYPADLFVAFGHSGAENSAVGKEIISKIADLPGWGEISSQNVADSIRTVSTEGVALSRFIYSLGIPFIGTHASQLLASQYGDVTKFLKAIEDASKYEIDGSSDEDEPPFGTLSEVKGIGPAALSALLSFAKEPVLVKAANDLAKALRVHDENQPAVESVSDGNDEDPSLFEGMTVVFTGALPGMSRTEAQAIVKRLGAKATPNTVSKSTALVVEGDKGGKKVKQARELGIRVISADSFLEMIS